MKYAELIEASRDKWWIITNAQSFELFSFFLPLKRKIFIWVAYNSEIQSIVIIVKHGSMQADIVLENELRLIHPWPKGNKKWSECHTERRLIKEDLKACPHSNILLPTTSIPKTTRSCLLKMPLSMRLWGPITFNLTYDAYVLFVISYKI